MRSTFTDAVRRVYKENRLGLYSYALSLAGDPEEAEDAIQAVFFTLLHRNRLPQDPRPYVFRCVRNAVIDNGRKERARTRSAERLDQPLITEEQSARDQAVRQCLSRISQDEREAIVLKIYGGLGLREIAEINGDSINTVASRYRRGLEKMRVMLEKEP